ncbi:MAG: hypothetical protein NUV82_03100 [Candidatus Komeilibacteria bacterium]|nr:hypothetical protein [Candidatus Komeilibacteria bacterium]
MTERMNFNSQEIKKNLLQHFITKLDEVNTHWANIDNSSGVIEESARSNEMSEVQVRSLENQIAGELASLDFNREDLSENDLAIINEYLSIGDIGDLQQRIADKAGIEYRDPFDERPTHSSGAAKQVLKEINKEKK